MNHNQSLNEEKFIFIPYHDPLGIKDITLGGDPPSINVEANIVNKQWSIQNGHKDPKIKNE